VKSVFIAHITGSRPHRIDHWTKPYQSASTAAAQVTRYVRRPDGTANGDWKGRIFRIDPTDIGSPCLVEVTP
jgi:hypothetical protein